jgi:hypothetical protein
VLSLQHFPALFLILAPETPHPAGRGPDPTVEQQRMRSVGIHVGRAALRCLLPADVRDLGRLPCGRLAGAALPQTTSGRVRNDCGRIARSVLARAARTGAAAVALPDGNPRHFVCRLAVRRGPLHVPRRARLPRRSFQSERPSSGRSIDLRHGGAVLDRARLRAVVDEGARTLLRRRDAFSRHAIHGRGNCDHRIPDARAHHPRTRLESHAARHVGALCGSDR